MTGTLRAASPNRRKRDADAPDCIAGCAVIISHDCMFLDRPATHMPAFEGESHVEWSEGNVADYEAAVGTGVGQPARYRVLAADAARPMGPPRPQRPHLARLKLHSDRLASVHYQTNDK